MAAEHHAGSSSLSSAMSSFVEGAILAARSWSRSKAAPPHCTSEPTLPSFCFNSTDSPPDICAASCASPAVGQHGPLSSLVFGTLEFLGVDMSQPSKITYTWPWVASPAPVITAVAVYLLIVAVWTHYIRVRGLQPRAADPAPLKVLVVCHNLFLCGLSLYMGTGLVYEAYLSGYSVWGNRCSDDNKKLAFYVYLFYMSKAYEFVDTAIMLLKRNLRQVSYLHVYHHATIAVIWWILCFRCPVGDTYFSAAFNSWIHVIMYSYYLLAAAIGKDEKRRKKYLFWGKYLTMLQITQFVSFIGQAVFFQILNYLKPGFSPDGIPRLLFFYSLSLLLFFLDFFVKKHLRNSRGRRQDAVAKKEI